MNIPRYNNPFTPLNNWIQYYNCHNFGHKEVECRLQFSSKQVRNPKCGRKRKIQSNIILSYMLRMKEVIDINIVVVPGTHQETKVSFFHGN